MKAQMSAEMLILIVVILAVVAIAASQLMKTAEKSGENIDKKVDEISERTDEALKGKEGDFCVERQNGENDCRTGLTCRDGECKR